MNEDIQISQTGNTIKFLRIANVGGVIAEFRFNSAGTSIKLEGTQFSLISNDRYIEEFEYADVSIPASSDAQDLLTILNGFIPASGGGGGGEVNTASNVGAGDGVFKQKTGVDLEFKTLIAGTNVTLTPGVDDVTIDSSGGGASTFLGLSDTPGTYSGNSGKIPVVNVGETALEFSDSPITIDFENILTATSTAATQNPTGLGDANQIQVEFGPAQNSGSDPVEIDANGTITCNKTGLYRFDIRLNFGRTGSAGVSLVHLQTFLTVAGPITIPLPLSIPVEIDNADISIPIYFDSVLTFEAGQSVELFIRRDPSGNDSGGLIQTDPTGVTTYSDTATATVTVQEIKAIGSGVEGDFDGIGTTAQRTSQIPTPTLGQRWLNTDHNVSETWDGDLWLNPNGIKVRNQTGGGVLVGQPMEMDGTDDGTYPDVIYAGFAQSDILAVIADAGGTYANGDYLFVVNQGHYPVYTSFSVNTGQFIRSLGGGDTDSLGSLNIGTFAQATEDFSSTPGTSMCFLFGAIRK